MASAGRPESAESGKPPAAPARVSSHDAPSSSRRASENIQLPKRAHTFQNDGGKAQPPDAFETSQDADDAEEPAENSRTSIDLDELPIELVTLTDSFVESLSAKVHSTPPNIDKLSQLFQDFYTLASSHIQTHISALATRQRRGPSPSPSTTSSISSAASRFRSRTASLKSSASNSNSKAKLEVEQQMITSEELADRKKARKALEAKKGLIEEAVERRLCEAIYDRIYRHRSTQDEAQDDKLRSKTAALALVNIGLTDLGIDLGQDDVDDTTTAPNGEGAPKFRDEEIRESLEPARQELVAMHEAHYPLGKLNHLKAVHKSIVDTLSHFQPNASADEIMPMLIYTLITLPPAHLHAISDLHFMQHFRWEPKLTGEAAYCLTNLEAAISFLETVDLSTLRDDEHPSGPPKLTTGEAATTTKPETFPPAYTQGTAASAAASNETATAAKPTASPGGLKAAAVLRNRRLSDLVNTPAQAFGAASGAVFSTADHGLKTISHSLGESYGFLVGKLRERQQGVAGVSPQESIVVPRTLDDARKLVSTPPLGDDDDTASVDSSAVATEDGDASGGRAKASTQHRDSVLTLIGGRREPSADSTRSRRSASSLKKVEFAESQEGSTPTTTMTAATTVAGAAQQQGAAMLDSVRSLGSSFNPMARLPSMGAFRGFGRNTPTLTTPTPTPPPPAPSSSTAANTKPDDGGDLSTAFPDLAAALPPKQRPPRIAPPNKRFMEISTPGELRLGEVLELLRDYRRLAGALKNLDAFEEK